MSQVESIVISNGDGRPVECSSVVEAMILVLIQADASICKHREGMVELHFHRATGKVDGKLKAHVGLERIRGT